MIKVKKNKFDTKMINLIFLLVISFVSCKKNIDKEFLGKVEDYYFPPIRIEYTYIDTNVNSMFVKYKIKIEKIYKMKWGYVLYEKHIPELKGEALRVFKKSTGKEKPINYIKAYINIEKQIVYTVNTDANWEKEGKKFIFIRGPLYQGAFWRGKVYYGSSIGFNNKGKSEKLVEKAGMRLKSKQIIFKILKGKDVKFENKIYKHILIKLIAPDIKKNEFDGSIFDLSLLKGIGLYSFTGFKLQSMKRL